MPPKDTKQKTFHYKRAVVIGGEPQSLSELIVAADAKEARPLKRAERLGEDGDNVRLVNRCYRAGKMVCGVFLDFTEGNHQPTIKIDENEIELAIADLPPRDREQFIEGMLFFGVQDDHVILLQSKGLRSAHFEQHLNWLLGEHLRLLPDGARVVLNDEPSKKARERLRGVKSVLLRAPVSLDKLRRTEETPAQRVSGAVLKQLWSALTAQGTFLEELSADHALALEDLELSVEIRRRGRAKGGPSLLDELAHTLRHSDDDLFELRTSSGRVLKSGDLKLTLTKSVQTKNGVPVLADVAQKMHDWLALLIEERHVQEVL